MRRHLAVFSALLLTACYAPASGPSPAAERSTVDVSYGGTSAGAQSMAPATVTTYRETRGVITVVPLARERVWKALLGAYASVGITVRTIDTGAGVIGNRDLQMRRHLNGERLTRFLRCGTNAFGAPHAANHLISASVLTFVSDVDGGTQVETRVEASASDPSLSTGAVQCTTTGELEARIVAALQAHLES